MRQAFWPRAAAAVTLLVGVGIAGSGNAGTPRVPTLVPVRALTPSYSAYGALTGAILFAGNVPPSARKHRYHRGWVEIGQQGHLVAKQWVKAGHQYHFRLTPGPYDIAAYTRWGTCRGSVQIPPDRTAHRNVACVWH